MQDGICLGSLHLYIVFAGCSQEFRLFVFNLLPDGMTDYLLCSFGLVVVGVGVLLSIFIGWRAGRLQYLGIAFGFNTLYLLGFEGLPQVHTKSGRWRQVFAFGSFLSELLQ